MKYKEHPGASGPLPQVTAYTDGSCWNGDRVGGWAAILQHDGREKELSGQEVDTTISRMELTGVLEALFACKNPVHMTVHSDSRYVVDGWTLYLPGWVRNGWVRADKAPVMNQDLWRGLLLASRVHTITMVHVKGHSTDVMNARADRLAGEARMSLSRVVQSADHEQRGRDVVSSMLGA